MKQRFEFRKVVPARFWWIVPLCLLLAVMSANLVMPIDDDDLLATIGKDKPLPTADTPATPVRPKAVHLSKHIVEYHIGVSYDEKNDTLIGDETFTWHHPGEQPVSELYLHLYPNAFYSMDSTFIRESGGMLRDSRMKMGRFGSMTITSIKTMEGEELLPRLKYVQPDDNNTADRSLAMLRLPSKVLPNGNVTLKLRFSVKLPDAFARMGVSDDFIMAGQWFPKLAVYETEGTRGRETEGWNIHQYHGNSEFYADFGIYNVAINVPDDYIVAATGFPTKPAVKRNGRKIYQFYADDVHDFAWSASPNFVYIEEPYSDKYVPGVKIKLYLDPAHEALKDRYLRAAKRSLSNYSEWYGAYPYSTLTIVVPPDGAEGTGGMEYPTLVTAWSAASEQPGLELERVIAHEIAHQFWYGMIASNEFEEAWLDEALASYSELRLMQHEYDESVNLPLEALHIANPAPLNLDAWKYKDHSQYASNVYMRGRLVLLAIEREIGSDKMKRTLRTYFQRWKFKHPSTADFQDALEDVTKRSWKTFFDQFVYGKEMLDYEVNSIEVKQVQKDGKQLFENTVKIVRNGGYHLPVPIIFYFSDNSITEKVWDGKEHSIIYTLTSDQRLLWAAIDPQYSLLMEKTQFNNILQSEVDVKWKARINLLIGKTIEALLNWAM